MKWEEDLGRRLRRNTNFAGLNKVDQERIKKVGFPRWFNEACDAQEKRFKERKNGRANRKTTKRKNKNRN